MHSGKRADIEEAIKLKMANNLIEKGIVIEAVLMKSIQLPRGLSSSIEQKLQAEARRYANGFRTGPSQVRGRAKNH